jgi:hypothetical protein
LHWWETRNIPKILMENPVGKLSIGRPSSWEDIIKLGVRRIY